MAKHVDITSGWESATTKIALEAIDASHAKMPDSIAIVAADGTTLDVDSIAADKTGGAEEEAAGYVQNLFPGFAATHNTYIQATNSAGTYVGDGWEHFEIDNNSSSDTAWQTFLWGYLPWFKPGETYTWLVELRNIEIDDAGDGVWAIRAYMATDYSGTAYSGGNGFGWSLASAFTDAQSKYYDVTCSSDDSDFPDSDAWDEDAPNTSFRLGIAFGAGASGRCDVRFSCYEQGYSGEYIPFIFPDSDNLIRRDGDGVEVGRIDLAGDYAGSVTLTATDDLVANVTDDVDVNVGDAIYIDSGATTTVTARRIDMITTDYRITLDSASNIDVDAASSIEVAADLLDIDAGKVSIGTDVYGIYLDSATVNNFTSKSSTTITSGERTKIDSAANIDIDADTCVNVDAGTYLDLDVGTNINADASGNIAVNANDGYIDLYAPESSVRINKGGQVHIGTPIYIYDSYSGSYSWCVRNAGTSIDAYFNGATYANALAYGPGAELKVTGYTCVGYVTNSKKSIRFDIHVGAAICSYSVEFTTLVVSVYQSGTALLSSEDVCDGATITFTTDQGFYEDCFHVRIDFDSALSDATNLDVCAIYINSGTIALG